MKNKYKFDNEHVSIILTRRPNSYRSLKLTFHGANDTSSTFSTKRMSKQNRTSIIVHAAGDCFKVSVHKACCYQPSFTSTKFFNVIKGHVDRYCSFVESVTGTMPTPDEARTALDLDGLATSGAELYRITLVKALLRLGVKPDLVGLDDSTLAYLKHIKDVGFKGHLGAEMIRREMLTKA